MREVTPGSPGVPGGPAIDNPGACSRQTHPSATWSALACLLCVLLMGCGNKGDLFLPTDVVASDELEEASEKLKKRKPEADE